MRDQLSFGGIDDADSNYDGQARNNTAEKRFLMTELERVESMEEILEELEEFYLETNMEEQDSDTVEGEGDVEDYQFSEDIMVWSEQTLSDIFGDLPDAEDDEFGNYLDDFGSPDGMQPYNSKFNEEEIERQIGNKIEKAPASSPTGVEKKGNFASSKKEGNISRGAIRQSSIIMANLEKALSQGVVPVGANVGSDALPGDFGFDPLQLATKDYVWPVQRFLLNLLPEPKRYHQGDEGGDSADMRHGDYQTARPRALILRDYREAEIRHGRLAMLAAIFWPLQEMLDQLLLEPDQAAPLIYGPVTLPYFPLFMTLIMLLLGYLDIYSQAVKDRDSIGEAFLPGDCFWDPLRILEGAPESMKRNMQERELFNGRVAMIAFAVFAWEESITHLPLNQIQGNELLLQPLYQVPYVQEWLDSQFASLLLEPSLDEIATDVSESLDDALSNGGLLLESEVPEVVIGEDSGQVNME